MSHFRELLLVTLPMMNALHVGLGNCVGSVLTVVLEEHEKKVAMATITTITRTIVC